MNVGQLANHMAQHAVAVRALVQGLSDVQARTRPEPDAWSMVDVLCHLLDEEREDFKVRIDFALHRPGEAAPEIRPGEWVTERRYSEQGLVLSLEGFLRERELSLAWLRSLSSADWEATYPAPWGPASAGDLLAAWVAHDILHLRQLVELRWALLTQALAPYSPAYAGEW